MHLLTSSLAALLPSQVPVELGRDDARRAAQAELGKQIYRDARPGLLQRLIGWLWHLLSSLLDRAAGASPGGWPGLLAVVVVVVLAVVALRLRLGPLRRADGREQPLFTGRARTAAEHRAAADQHAAAGRFDEAVRDRLRAVITGLEERSLLDPRPGSTADEAAAAAAVAVPSSAVALRDAARVFDEIWYGGRTATAEHDRALRELDDAIRAARPLAGSALVEHMARGADR